MNGKERVKTAMRCEEVDRVPWVPFAGCHNGYLLGVTAQEYLQSEDLIVKGVEEAIGRYQPDGIPVLFDLQVEAEIFGCELIWAGENPPAVSSHPLQQGKSLDSIEIPKPDQGRLAMALSAAKRIRSAHDDIALYGLITGPFTLALHLYGTNIFMSMFDDPETVRKLMNFCGEAAKEVAGYYIDAGCDVVAVVDPMTSQIGPDQFKQFVTPAIMPVFESIRERGALSSFFVCGHAQQNIKVMCDCRPDNVSVDENIPLDYVRDVCLKRNVSFGGNLQLTTVLLLGSEAEAQRNALACMEIGGKKGFILAPGCDLPFQTPPKNLEAVARLVNDPYEQEIARTMAEEKTPEQLLDMRDYGHADRVIVDIITLDSEACAPCQYMVESVKAIAPEFEGIVEWHEHKIKYKESLVFMTSLMVRNVPTICIDGKITFVSRIPSKEELIAAIQQRINEKLRLKIQRRRASIRIFGKKDDEYNQTLENVHQAMMELGTDLDIIEINEEEKMRVYGITPRQTPAVIVAKYELKSTKTVPEVNVVKEWIKDVS